MLNNFITGLMRSIGTMMFIAGAAFLAYAVVGGYHHYTPWLNAIAWGFAGWVLFFVGIDLVQQYKVTDVPTPPPPPAMPTPLPSNPYAGADTNTRNPWPSKPGGGQQTTPNLDDQWEDD